MYDMEKQMLEGMYNPCQPGYKRAGKYYMELNYSEDCRLGAYISTFFEVLYPVENVIHVIPDGCNDIIVTYDGNTVASWLSPSISKASKFHFEKLNWLFGIRFLPGATYAIFHDYLKYNAQSAVDMKLLFDDFQEIEKKLSEARSFAKRYEIMEAYLANKISKCHGVQDILQYYVKYLIDAKGMVSVKELAAQTGYSVRYIRQLFAKHVGHSPKELANIIRMQSALQFLWENADVSLGDTAIAFGFSDQSHMNREFRKFLGITSGVIKENENWILDLKTDRWRIF